VAADSTEQEADFTVVAAGSTVAVEAEVFTEEVAGSTVGKVTTINPLSGDLQEAQLGRFARIHFDPSLGPIKTRSGLSPTAAHSIDR
jgi:hypothetical protein